MLSRKNVFSCSPVFTVSPSRGSVAIKISDPCIDNAKAVVKKKVTAIQDAQRTEMRKLFSGGNSEGMREKMTAMREKTQKQIEAILTDEQKKKFKEMQSQRPTRPQGRPGGEGKGKQRPGRSDA